MRQGAYLRGELNREFTVIKQKPRAGQFRHHNSQILDFRYCTPDSLSAENGFRITIIIDIKDSLSWTLDSIGKRFLDFRFHKQKFPGFWKLPYWGDH